jgi:hypothetical protein
MRCPTQGHPKNQTKAFELSHTTSSVGLELPCLILKSYRLSLRALPLRELLYLDTSIYKWTSTLHIILINRDGRVVLTFCQSTQSSGVTRLTSNVAFDPKLPTRTVPSQLTVPFVPLYATNVSATYSNPFFIGATYSHPR